MDSKSLFERAARLIAAADGLIIGAFLYTSKEIRISGDGAINVEPEPE